MPKIDFAFFGSDEFASTVLNELAKHGWKPNPESKNLFVVASYGKILTKEELAIPKHGTLNIHPSLLPKYRGASPIQAAILSGDEETGVCIMLVDEKMDHGPVLASQKVKIKGQNYLEVKENLARIGARLLVEVAPKYIAGEIRPVEQDHSQATFTKKIKRDDGEVKLTDDPVVLYRKFLAYDPWPGIFFFDSRGKRIKITAAKLENGEFTIERVLPEAKREMDYSSYVRGLR